MLFSFLLAIFYYIFIVFKRSELIFFLQIAYQCMKIEMPNHEFR